MMYCVNYNSQHDVDVLLVCIASWHENAFGIAGPFLGESTGHRILLTMDQKYGALVFPLVLSWTSCWTKSRFDGYLAWRLCHFNVLALVY